jgi:hypothetical protein
MTFIKYLFITIFFFGITNVCLAQVEKDTLRILFVGNSYTFISNMPHLISEISDSTKVKLITSQSTAGGATLSDHWNGKKELKTREIIKKGDYDIVVLQEHSMGTIQKKEDFFQYSKKLCDLIKASGAKPFFYVTWARQKVPQYQDIITKVYQQASEENNSGLIMVGEAWKLARSLRPDVPLFMLDGSHQSDLGAFLTACVFTGAFSGELPQNLPNWYEVTDANGEKIMLFWENSLDVIFCRRVASTFIKSSD